MKLLNLWEKVQGSYWFVPTLMCFASVALSFITLAIDRSIKREILEEIGYFYTGGPEGARELFSTVAASMITVAGVTFSITIVALTLAAQQFGPRLLHNFMHDTTNHVVLGTFLGTFLYCLLILRTVRSLESSSFVPHVSATVAVLLAVCSLGVLIYFIHHVAYVINVSNVVHTVSDDLQHGIGAMFPRGTGNEPPSSILDPAEAVPGSFEETSQSIRCGKSGYVSTVDGARLLEIAKQDNLVVRLHARPGDFVLNDSIIATAWPQQRVGGSQAEEIGHCFVIGNVRTALQDIEFSLHQLVETAVRALSPGINDPHTAINCIDYLGAGLSRILDEGIPSAYRYDDEGNLRLICHDYTFGSFVDAAFNEIRQYAGASAAVYVRLLEVINALAPRINTLEARDTLQRHAIMVERAARRNLPEDFDREDVQRRYDTAMEMLDRIQLRELHAVGSNIVVSNGN